MGIRTLVWTLFFLPQLITRFDDTESIVNERLRIYNEKSQPVEDLYRSKGKLLEFDLPDGIPESLPKLLGTLNLDEVGRSSLQQHRLFMMVFLVCGVACFKFCRHHSI